MKSLKDKCDAFLDAIPYELVQEFQQKYCCREAYYSFAKNDRENYIKSVLQFSQSHVENSYFQYLAKCYLGSPEVRETLLLNMLNENNVPAVPAQHASKSVESEKIIGSNHTDRPELKPEPRHKTHGQLFGPVMVHSDDDLRKSIDHKLYGEPRDHDRYTRLTPEEKRFILRYAGLSKKERVVFEEKCDRRYFPYREIARRLGVSESLIKKRAVQIDKRISNMLEN